MKATTVAVLAFLCAVMAANGATTTTFHRRLEDDDDTEGEVLICPILNWFDPYGTLMNRIPILGPLLSNVLGVFWLSEAAITCLAFRLTGFSLFHGACSRCMPPFDDPRLQERSGCVSSQAELQQEVAFGRTEMEVCPDKAIVLKEPLELPEGVAALTIFAPLISMIPSSSALKVRSLKRTPRQTVPSFKAIPMTRIVPKSKAFHVDIGWFVRAICVILLWLCIFPKHCILTNDELYRPQNAITCFSGISSSSPSILA